LRAVDVTGNESADSAQVMVAVAEEGKPSVVKVLPNTGLPGSPAERFFAILAAVASLTLFGYLWRLKYAKGHGK
jgi:hypothetical protein